MALHMNKQETRSELQERIAADLRAKASSTSYLGGDASPSTDTEKSTFVEGTKKTTSLAGVWLFLFLVFVAVIIFIITR